MNNLNQALAPISKKAWEEIEEEVVRTFKRNLAGRRMVDLNGPHGSKFSCVGTGHLSTITSPLTGVEIQQHQVMPLVKMRIPFELDRKEIDAIEYGSQTSEWQPAKDAAQKLAHAEDQAIFQGMASANIEGMIASSNPHVNLPDDPDDYPEAISEALKLLRLEGVDGPYVLAMGTEAFTQLSGASDDGYPVASHVRRQVDEDVIWAPGIEGAFLVSTRGGDFELSIGRDLSIGYQSHTDQKVKLYLEETLTFRLLSPEAVVVIRPNAQVTGKEK